MRAASLCLLLAGCPQVIATQSLDAQTAPDGAASDLGPGGLDASLMSGPDASVQDLAGGDAACVPDCTSRACGLDPVCGLPCGECSDDETCRDGECRQECPAGSFECLPGNVGYRPCGYAPARGRRELGAPVACPSDALCDQRSRCDLAECRPAQLMLLLDRSAAMAEDSLWNLVVSRLRPLVADRALAGRFGIRSFPTRGCQAEAPRLPSAGARNLVDAQDPPTLEASRPLGAALDGLIMPLQSDRHGTELLIITAGTDTCETPTSVRNRVSALHHAGVRTHLLAVGRVPDLEALHQLAAEGGTRRARHATNAVELDQALAAVFDPLCPNSIPQVDVGYYHACRRNPDGIVQCWGRDLSGESTAPSERFEQVSAGTDFTCAVITGGSLTCWGRNQHGQLLVPAGGSFQAVSAGNGHACALTLSGEVQCWGRNEDGQNNAPQGPFTQISAGAFHTCGVRRDGSLSCWGLGRHRPDGQRFEQVSAGTFHTCALRQDQRISCAGSNSHGQARPPPDAFREVAAGDDHTCGIRTNGTVSCWGSDVFGQHIVPLVAFDHISADNNYTCGVTADGQQTLCWGEGSNGQTVPPP